MPRIMKLARERCPLAPTCWLPARILSYSNRSVRGSPRRRIGRFRRGGRKKKHYLAPIRNIRLTIPPLTFIYSSSSLSLSFFGANRAISTRFCEINNTLGEICSVRLVLLWASGWMSYVSTCLSSAPCISNTLSGTIINLAWTWKSICYRINKYYYNVGFILSFSKYLFRFTCEYI